MKTELQSVLLTGTYRGERAEALFVRMGRIWELRTTVGRSRRIQALSANQKPCWTVALVHFDLMTRRNPTKQARNRMKRDRSQRHPATLPKVAQGSLRICTDD